MSYMKTEYERKAEEICDEAVRELIGVAREFARQTDTYYKRTITDWSVSSSFNRYTFHDCRYWHSEYMKTINDVSLDTSKLEYSESYELAWHLEAAWNKRADVWRKAMTVIDGLLDRDPYEDVYDEVYDATYDEVYDDIADALERMAEIVELWLDSAECWYGSGEFLEELEEVAA